MSNTKQNNCYVKIEVRCKRQEKECSFWQPLEDTGRACKFYAHDFCLNEDAVKDATFFEPSEAWIK